MIGRLTGIRGQLSSHWLASVFALTYLVASAGLGVALLTSPEPVERDATPAANTPPYVFDSTTTPADVRPNRADDSGSGGPARAPTTTTKAPATVAPPPTYRPPAGFERVSGPAGMLTVVPTGWSATRSTGPGSIQATDPADASHYVKYGGSQAPPVAIEPSHIQYENDFAARSMDYRRIELSSGTYGGHPAVVWEFEHRDGPAMKHIRSLYWRVDDKEYFLLASGPPAHWPQMRPIYDTMVAHSEP